MSISQIGPDGVTWTEAVAGEVRAALARQRVAQGVVAEALGVSQAAVSRRMNGHIPFDVAQLGVIAELAQVRISDLIPEVLNQRVPGSSPGWRTDTAVAA